MLMLLKNVSHYVTDKKEWDGLKLENSGDLGEDMLNVEKGESLVKIIEPQTDWSLILISSLIVEVFYSLTREDSQYD